MHFFKKFGFILFGIVAITDIVFLSLEINRFRYYTKPLLLPVLLLIILAQSQNQKHPVSKNIVSLALIAGAIGDFLLLRANVNPDYFTYGLGAFLIMQLLYCFYFFRMQSLKSDFMIINIFIVLFFAGYAFTLVGSLYNFLGDLRIPVMIYSVVIMTMLFAATNIYHSKKAHKLAVRFFIPGAAFLVLSDSILAVNKFYLKDDLFNISVMVTYILGQLFLSLGFIKHLKSSRGSNRRRRHKEEPPETEAAVT